MSNLDAIAQIDFCYWQIGELQKELAKKQSPLEQMIDDATGYGKEQVAAYCESAAALIETIIENKKSLGIDYERDIEFLEKVKNLQ